MWELPMPKKKFEIQIIISQPFLKQGSLLAVGHGAIPRIRVEVQIDLGCP
jgi:hypothetical protein